jgi:predicted HicB family RNase H-like nuclease
MESNNHKKTKQRMIHVRLPEAIHKKVRISAAEADETLQEWVAKAIKNELTRQAKSDGGVAETKDCA